MTRDQFATWQVFDDTGRRKYLNDAERARFLAAAGREPSAASALCHVLVFTGCRISEALALRRHQLDAERMTLAIRTLKRRRLAFRVVPIPAELVAMLQVLQAVDGGHFWTMHRATAWRLVKRVMNQVGIKGPMACCRGLRHGFGIRAAGHHVPPNVIQRWMGHSSSATTAIYLDALGQEERNFAERMWCIDVAHVNPGRSQSGITLHRHDLPAA